jgi:hypothetical protein
MIMDNRVFNVNGKGEDFLEKVLALALQHKLEKKADGFKKE